MGNLPFIGIFTVFNPLPVLFHLIKVVYVSVVSSAEVRVRWLATLEVASAV